MSRFWDDKLQVQMFKRNLAEAERRVTTDSQAKFVEDMRGLAKANEDLADMGLAKWEPTARQLNYLSSLAGS